jgi:hypothetical protein
MLANSPEEKKHTWPKCESKEIDRVVDANAQQTGDNRRSDIEAVMIAKRQTWLVQIPRRIGPILQMRNDRVVFVEIGLIMKIEQDRRKDDWYRR